VTSGDTAGDAAVTGVLVPVKAFADAKVRLAPALDPTRRATLARTMATGVVRAAGDLAVWVVCDDDDVAEWAAGVGAAVLWMPRRGLNLAVTEGVAALAAAGVTRVVVCHADLPAATRLDHLVPPEPAAPTMVVVPDRRRDGTNVVSLPTTCGFRFAYGAGSFERHLIEARRLGLDIEVVDDPGLSWDVDVPEDLLPLPTDDRPPADATRRTPGL
jgi:2-phospho-L-lactate guanylyltransferase